VVQVAHHVESSGEGQDRVSVLRLDDATVLFVADGSGGMSGGAQVAERALQELSRRARRRKLSEQTSWVAMLAGTDGLLKYARRDRIAVSPLRKQLALSASLR